MSCYSPLNAYDLGARSKTGKVLYKIVGPGEIYKTENGDFLTTPHAKVPCSKCIGCRLDYSRNWANRLVFESRLYDIKNCHFITLTYEHAPMNDYVDPETGEVKYSMTLRPIDLTNFLKRLRIYYNRHYGYENVRFYAAGEYGDRDGRPHYHIILFNLPINDLKKEKNSQSGFPLFTSNTISRLWGYGHVWIGGLSWDSCAYVARYCLKKVKGPSAKDFYSKAHKLPEFVRMSRNGGIGKHYFDKNWEHIYKHDEIHVKKGDKVFTCKPPRFFDRLYSVINEKHFDLIKERRKAFALNNDLLLRSFTDLSDYDYNHLKATNKLFVVKKSLIRRL